jgi:hypothetical protein
MSFTYKQYEDGLSSQKLGEQVSIYDRYMCSSGLYDGKISIYERKNSEGWSKISDISYPSEDNFGKAVVLYKRNLFVSRTNNTYGVYVFSASDDFTTVTSTFSSLSSLSDISFGESLSVSDNVVAIGCPGYGTNGQGAVYLYEKEEDEEWGDVITRTNHQIIQSEDLPNGQLFGTTVSISGSFLAIGAKGDNGNSGAVYIFKKNEETEIWEQFQKIIASDGEVGD